MALMKAAAPVIPGRAPGNRSPIWRSWSGSRNFKNWSSPIALLRLP